MEEELYLTSSIGTIFESEIEEYDPFQVFFNNDSQEVYISDVVQQECELVASVIYDGDRIIIKIDNIKIN